MKRHTDGRVSTEEQEQVRIGWEPTAAQRNTAIGEHFPRLARDSHSRAYVRVNAKTIRCAGDGLTAAAMAAKKLACSDTNSLLQLLDPVVSRWDAWSPDSCPYTGTAYHTDSTMAVWRELHAAAVAEKNTTETELKKTTHNGWQGLFLAPSLGQRMYHGKNTASVAGMNRAMYVRPHRAKKVHDASVDDYDEIDNNDQDLESIDIFFGREYIHIKDGLLRGARRDAKMFQVESMQANTVVQPETIVRLPLFYPPSKSITMMFNTTGVREYGSTGTSLATRMFITSRAMKYCNL